MEGIYKKTKKGMEYIVYETPVRMKKVDILPNYKEGGAFLYQSDEDSEEINLLAHIKYVSEWEGMGHFYRYELRRTEDAEILEADGCRLEVFPPVDEVEFNLKNPQIMSEDCFFKDSDKTIRHIADKCHNVYGTSDDELILYARFDRAHKGVIFYGYSIRELSEEEQDEIDTDWEMMNYDQFLRLQRKYFSSSVSDTDEEVSASEEEDEDMLGKDIMAAVENEKHLPKIAYDIRRWLRKTSFADFCKAITDRVKGQEQTEMIVIHIYNYLECVAYGKPHNNNMLVAAPSGCGKTETYRAVRDYFATAIPGLVVYQMDMTSVTEEGFKGANTKDILAPLVAQKHGIGIGFLDEFDKKLLPSFTSGGNNVNLAVQSQILTVIEGRMVAVGKDVEIDTNNTLFIAMGAFDMCRQKKTIGEKHPGFDRCNVEGQKHYADITREDMIDVGGCYELIGRFSSVINYHELTPEIVDEIIDGMLVKIERSIGCDIKISEVMRQKLQENANGKYGCRILEGMIRENVMQGYLSLCKAGRIAADYVICVEDVGNVHCEAKQEEQEEFVC